MLGEIAELSFTWLMRYDSCVYTLIILRPVAKTLMVLLFSLKESYDMKTLSKSIHVTNFYTDALLGFVAVVGLIYLTSSKPQMGKCQSAELVSPETRGFLPAASLQTLLVLESVCCCAVRKIITISFLPSQPGP